MAHMDIPITSDTIVDESDGMALGPIVLNLPEGPALCRDARSLTSITAERAGRQFLVVISVAEHNGECLGSLSPMTPTQARAFAASLVHGANKIDGSANG